MIINWRGKGAFNSSVPSFITFNHSGSGAFIGIGLVAGNKPFIFFIM